MTHSGLYGVFEIERNAELYLSAADKDLSVSMTGHEWHCLICAFNNEPLTEIGQQYVRSGIDKLRNQLRRQTHR